MDDWIFDKFERIGVFDWSGLERFIVDEGFLIGEAFLIFVILFFKKIY